jgi:hypothetical protein
MKTGLMLIIVSFLLSIQVAAATGRFRVEEEGLIIEGLEFRDGTKITICAVVFDLACAGLAKSVAKACSEGRFVGEISTRECCVRMKDKHVRVRDGIQFFDAYFVMAW